MRAAIGVWVLVVVVTVVASGYLEGCFAGPTTERPPAASFDLVLGIPMNYPDLVNEVPAAAQPDALESRSGFSHNNGK